MRLLLSLILIAIHFSAFAQNKGIGTAVTIEDAGSRLMTEQEIQASKNMYERLGKLKFEYSKLLNRCKYPENPTGHDKTYLQRILDKNLKAQQCLNGNGFSQKCAEIRTLSRKLEMRNKHHCEHENRLAKIKRFNNTVRQRLNGVEAEEKQNQNQSEELGEGLLDQKHEKKLSAIDKDISGIDDELAMLDKRLNTDNAELKAAIKKSKSIDDFLENMDTKEVANNNSDDFLDDIDKEDADDFLSEDDNDVSKGLATKDYRVDSNVNGEQGVVNKEGDVLIPYRKWKVISYKGGIAKVNERGEEFETSCGIAYYVIKTSFVDELGDYLDEPHIDFGNYRTARTVHYYNPKYYSPLTLYTSTPTAATRARVAAREKRKRLEHERKAERASLARARKEKQCEISVNSWKRRMIAQY